MQISPCKIELRLNPLSKMASKPTIVRLIRFITSPVTEPAQISSLFKMFSLPKREICWRSYVN